MSCRWFVVERPPRARRWLLAVAAIALGCSEPAPRFGEVSISAASPRATFSGTTFGSAAAMELAPGCPGYLDVETPGHVVHVSEDVSFEITARSEAAPLALAVAHDDEVRCASDEGSGHAPSLSFERAGDYLVFVAALREPAELAYEVRVRAGDARQDTPVGLAEGERLVNVTITSEPSGARVRDSGGQVLGMTPAMFAVVVDAGAEEPSRSWTLSLPEHEEVTVTGSLDHSTLVLHGQLSARGPVQIDVSSTETQPVVDFQRASLGVDVGQDCEISSAEVEVDVQHPAIGDLRVVLRTPWDEELVLHRHTGGGRRNLRRTWRSHPAEPSGGARSAAPVLGALVGRRTRGRWIVTVHDDAGEDEGTFDRFDLHLACGTTPAAPPAERPAPRPSEPRATPSRPRPRRLPELPTRADIVRSLGALRPRVEQCGRGQGGSARVLATVVGATGRVREVATTGVADEAVRRCVSRVVRSARFGRFRRQSLDVDYTYGLR